MTLGIVVIGRNEGERLRLCLQSVAGSAIAVYVDSGSTDGSVAAAKACGADVIELDMAVPFTAARARNAGFERLYATVPAVSYVQFVDGDCEIVAGWLTAATAFLDGHTQVGVVCGRRRERHPERSPYNRLCDIEWNTPIGEARACGGDAMMRVAAFHQAGGFREQLIAGEEPELCVRVRGLGWKVWRLDAEMTLHDAAMTRFSQWWRRSTRAGFAFAEGAALHGASPERHWVRESRSALFWGLGMPMAVAVACAAFGPVAAWGLAVYPVQFVRLLVRAGGPPPERALRAGFLMVGKFAEAFGQARFWLARARGRRPGLIEYK